MCGFSAAEKPKNGRSSLLIGIAFHNFSVNFSPTHPHFRVTFRVTSEIVTPHSTSVESENGLRCRDSGRLERYFRDGVLSAYTNDPKDCIPPQPESRNKRNPSHGRITIELT